jgi:hypothetical protein
MGQPRSSSATLILDMIIRPGFRTRGYPLSAPLRAARRIDVLKLGISGSHRRNDDRGVLTRNLIKRDD